MTQKPKLTLLKNPRVDEAEMDRMSEAAFAGIKGTNKPHLYDWKTDEKDGHFIDKPELPAAKTTGEFLGDLRLDVAARELGKLVSTNVVSIDVNSVNAGVEQVVPVSVEHTEVA